MGRGQSGLENPERERTYGLATVRPGGWPHVMPLLSLWLDDAFYFLTSETTRKGKNLRRLPVRDDRRQATPPRCSNVPSMGSATR